MTTPFAGTHYEKTNGVATKYYGVYPEPSRRAGTQRVAMRSGSTLSYLLTDHLGSTSITTDANGVLVSELRYKPWGETRYASGATPTKYQFTGQFSYASDFGLLFYNARWYNPAIGRFAQADTDVPASQGVQAYDRFAYANNNPLRYTDPTGHWACDDQDENGKCINYEQISHRKVMNLRRQFKNFKPFDTYGWDEMIPTTFIDIPEIPGVGGPYNVTKLLTYDEWKLFLNTWGLDDVALLKFGLISQLAKEEAGNLFPDQPEDGTPRNAFQHAYWNAMLAQHFGIEFAESLTNGHERGYGQDGANGLFTFMDLHNNAVGIGIVEANPGASSSEIFSLTLDALANGELVVLDVDSVDAGDRSANTIYPSNQCPQWCTSP